MIQQTFLAAFILSGLTVPLSFASVSFAPTWDVQGKVTMRATRNLPLIPNRPEAPVHRSPQDPGPELSAIAGIVFDRSSGTVLWQKEPDTVVPIASLSKLMTAMVFLDQETDWQTVEQMDREENELEGAKLFVGDGDTVRQIDLFYSALVGSANNATQALADGSGLTEEAFLQQMNERAAALGLEHTAFFDVTGLNPKNVSTVKELAVLGRAAFAYPEIADATTRVNHEMRSVGRDEYHNVETTNLLLKAGDLRITGSKTGYLDEAGYNLLTQVEVNDRVLMIVLVGAKSHFQRFTETRRLIEWVEDEFF